VRYREYTKNIKREFNKCIALVQAYGLISTGVRLSFWNQQGKGYSRRHFLIIVSY